MSIGMEEAAGRVGQHLTVAFAVDADPNVLDIYKRNVTGTVVRAADVAKIFDGDLGETIWIVKGIHSAEAGGWHRAVVGPPRNPRVLDKLMGAVKIFRAGGPGA
jgi:hypothetical protein